jgi:hypothetical protein
MRGRRFTSFSSLPHPNVFIPSWTYLPYTPQQFISPVGICADVEMGVVACNMTVHDNVRTSIRLIDKLELRMNIAIN